MGAGLVRVRLLRLHAGTESPGTGKRALQKCPRRFVEEQSDHAPNGDPWRLVPGSTFRNRRLSLREIIDLHCPLARMIHERFCCNRMGEGLVARVGCEQKKCLSSRLVPPALRQASTRLRHEPP